MSIFLSLIFAKEAAVAAAKGENSNFPKNAPKPSLWNTKDKRNVESLLTKYEVYREALGVQGDNERVRFFTRFFKAGECITSMAWMTTRSEEGPINWKDFREWVLITWRKPH